MIGLCLFCVLATSAGGAPGASAASPGAVAWGDNADGQLGNGTTVNSDQPVAVSGLSEVTTVSAGGNHSLALLSNGTVMAWGENGSGQLGNGTTTNSDVPVAVSGLTGVTAIAAGAKHSLALLSNGTVMAWGSNNDGQLGNGTITSSDVPVAVSGLSGVTAIAAGALHSMALLSNGTVMAWGGDAFGQLGNGATTNGELLPVAVTGLSGVSAIAAGDDHSLAVLSNGTAMAWGDNKDGQLGNGTTTNSDIPVAVSALSEFTAVSGGQNHSLALSSNGTVMAWGDNAKGQLGNGTTTNSDVPVAVSGLSGVKVISGGGGHSLALLSSGIVMAWGAGDKGQLGNGSASDSEIPVAVSGAAEVKGISAGALHSLAYGPQIPVVTEVAPKAGPPTGGTSITISGTNFTGATAVKFGTTNAKSFEVNSATTITAVSPAGSNVVDVTVSTPGGTSATSAADLFSYLPTVTNVNPNTGPQAGGTTATITGTNFIGVTAVKFGTANAKSFEVNSASTITAVSPAGSSVVDVTVTTSGGMSPTSSADRFTYLGAAPEFGRCVKVAAGAGAYANRGCTTAGGEGNYEWLPGPGPKSKFTTKIKTGESFIFESVGGTAIQCAKEKGTGEYSGPKTMAAVVLRFTGCASGKSKCSTTGSKEGEIVTNALQGELGVVKVSAEGPLQNEIGFDLKAVGAAAIVEFACGGVTRIWSGSVIVAVSTNSMLSKTTLKYAATAGKQKPEQFEGQPKDIIESSLGGGAFEQSSWTITTVQTNEEKMEVNSVV